MKLVAFGIMGISKSEFEKMFLYEVLIAYKGYQQRKEEEKALIRWQCYYQLAPYQKNGFNISNVWLPGDPLPEKKVAVVKKLTAEEVQELYRKSGFNISKDNSNKLVENKRI